MYETFFSLKHKPFSLLPDPDFLYLSTKHALALSLLEYCLSGQAGFCVITGEIGSGKTTLVRAFLSRVGREFTVGIIANTHNALENVSAWALSAFGQKATGTTPAETYQDLMAYLIAEYGEGRQCILIVDEAQNLSIDSMEELRLLSNINSGKDLLLQIMLVGQPELLGKLKRPELTQFAQRIAVSHHLAPLSYAETRQYIQHRLRVAGTESSIFTEMAMGAIQYFSGGVPRLVNSICDLALVYAFADGQTTVNEDLVFRVVADRQSSGIAPFARSEAAHDPGVLAEISQLAASAVAKPMLERPPQIEASIQRSPQPISRPLLNPSNDTNPPADKQNEDDSYFGSDESDPNLLLSPQAADALVATAMDRRLNRVHSTEVPALRSDVRGLNGSLRPNDGMELADRSAGERQTTLSLSSWQAPAVSLSSPTLSSINGHGNDAYVVTPLANTSHRSGTETSSSRSWWRGFLRRN